MNLREHLDTITQHADAAKRLADAATSPGFSATPNREEVMPTEPGRYPATPALDTPPPSARSQAGAFVPLTAQELERAREIWGTTDTWPQGLNALGAFFAARAPAAGPSVERIAEIIRQRSVSPTYWMERKLSLEIARDIAALFPAPAALPPEVAELVSRAKCWCEWIPQGHRDDAQRDRAAHAIVRDLAAVEDIYRSTTSAPTDDPATSEPPLADRISAILNDDLHIPHSQRHRIPAAAEKIARVLEEAATKRA